MRGLIILLTLVAAVAAVPSGSRIVGGSFTTIEKYPDMVALLFSPYASGHRQECGGAIINNRSILTAAHCIFYDAPPRWRARVGSTYASSGGVVHTSRRFLISPLYDRYTLHNDIALIHVMFEINLNNIARAGRIAGPNYVVPDNAVVWAAGWGVYQCPVHDGGQYGSEILRHVQMWKVNWDVCNQRLNHIGMALSKNMICSGWLDVGGRDQCVGDSGSPLYHDGVVVGVCSFGPDGSCGSAFFPGVSALVSPHATWINDNR